MSINPRLDPRLAGEIPRYHTWPHLRPQSIAEHSWQLMRIVKDVSPFAVPSCVYEYILHHDVGETATGDIPYPVKKNNPDLKAIMDELEATALKDMGIKLPVLPSYWYKLIKACELIEMWEWAYGELLRGNEFARLVMERCRGPVDLVEDHTVKESIIRYMSKREQMWGTP
jgi:5'-deoxynucleotidase YfbR-like HD superfamily hydrolase